MIKDNSLQVLQENFFFNIKETTEQNPEIRKFFNKVAESINGEAPNEIIEGKFVILGRTNGPAVAYLLFIANNKAEEFLNLVRTIRSGGFIWEIANSKFFISVRIARIFYPWRSKVIIEIDNEELLVVKSFVEKYFEKSATEFIFSYNSNVCFGDKITNELNMGT